MIEEIEYRRRDVAAAAVQAPAVEDDRRLAVVVEEPLVEADVSAAGCVLDSLRVPGTEDEARPHY